MSNLLLLCSLLFPPSLVFAQFEAPAFHPFLKSLENSRLISTKALETSLKGVRLAKPSWLQRQGLVASEAEATYNSWLNTVILKEEYTTSDELGLRVKTWDELAQMSSAEARSFSAVALHELAHAQYEGIDEPLKSQLKTELVDLLRQQGVGYFTRQRAPSEYYAYFQEDLFRWLSSELDEILFWNGLDAANHYRCLSSDSLKARLRAIPLESRNSFILFPENKIYDSSLIAPTAIVDGEDVPLPTTSPFFRKLHLSLWQNSVREYSIPLDRKSLVLRMNQSKELLGRLKICRSQPDTN